ncbi:MAG TPA: cytochrome c [Burkholderiaceae bacterium]|nr:cytochrome c [Burkholderiaceae bacterium]
MTHLLRAGLLLAALLLAGCAPRGADAPPAAAPATVADDAALVARGRELALIGNCAGCHTAPGGAPYAGGLAIPTPFGPTYAGNLTPEVRTGLGRWTREDFWTALHEGRARDGRPLVPTFPYTSYTHVRREDSDALFAYLRSLPAVHQPDRPHELRFPFGSAVVLRAWQWLFFEPADLAADEAARRALPERAARGAYLVQGLGHCGACHAPRNAFGAPSGALTGGEMSLQGWTAPSLHPRAGDAGHAEEMAALLRAGQTARSTVLGPMADVVYRSLQHWPPADIAAVADFLARLPPEPAPAAAPADAAQLDRGRAVYGEQCADCHGRDGEGAGTAYPALAGNPTVLQPSPRNLVQVVRFGGFAPVTAANPRPYGMPPASLSDADTAAVLSFVRQSWGNRAGAVSALDVLKLQ